MSLRVFFLICALYSGTLFAKLEDHLKKAPDKGTCHTMKNIDFIYTINLDERPAKFESCTSQLHPYGIFPYRFSAVNGWKLTLTAINDLGIKYSTGMKTDLMGTYYPLDGEGAPCHEIMSVPGRNYFCHCMSRGAIGCALSHLSVLQDALDSGYKAIWVMEDDIQVLQDPHLISKRIDELDKLVGKNGWDMLFTDQDTINNNTGKYVPCLSHARRPNFSPSHPERFAKRTEINKDFRKVGARYGMYSVIIRRSGIKKILNFTRCANFVFPSTAYVFQEPFIT
jgi:GR25 family glycosyltransferase involved in LPS biosynthesis